MIESNYLVANEQNVQKLMVIPHLNNFDPKELEDIVRQSRVRQYKDGEVIMAEGSQDEWLIFLLSGRVKILKDDVVIGEVERAGEVFGEMSMIDGTPRSATIQSLGDTICLAVNSTEERSRLEHPQERMRFKLTLHRIFVKILADRLRTRTDELSEARKDIGTLNQTITELREQLSLYC